MASKAPASPPTLAFSNSIDRTLRDLGIERKAIERDMSPDEMAQIIKAEVKDNG